MKYRKKPIIIEAVQLIEPATPDEVADWCGAKVCGHGACGEKVWLEITTSEGVMRADYGDWIIKEPFPTADRQYYPCKDSIFQETYEPVEV